MASQIGVPPLQGQISENLSMLKVKQWSDCSCMGDMGQWQGNDFQLVPEVQGF